jgi:pyridinium-3,5-bisthiocarboxylic acid mononucleotide nickel chelatase
MAAGALDVFCTPIQMKKNRPGTLLSVLARPANEQNLVDILFAESTTIGVRIREEHRRVLERRTVPVKTPWGEVRMKVAHLAGAVRNAAPEYEDCRKIAAEHHIPLKRVMEEALRIYSERQNG